MTGGCFLVRISTFFLIISSCARSTVGWLSKVQYGRSVTWSLKAQQESQASTPKKELLSLLSGQTDPVLSCPVSLEPLVKTERFIGTPDVKWECSKFGTTYRKFGPYIDLSPSAGEEKSFLGRSLQEFVQTDFFRNPFIAFVYERGWRQGFANAGFPGVDAEFKLLLEFFGSQHGSEDIKEIDGLIPDLMEGTILDMSCGSGLMSRRLAKQMATFPSSRLISADYSEAMLLETKRRFDEERKDSPSLSLPDLIRCDVAKLPFGSKSIDGCHAGAALHCWPQLEEGLAEVCRVLKPGGRFFATTFKKGAYGVPRQVNSQGGASFRFFDVDELEGLLKDAGFSDVDVELVGQGCLIARCTK